MNDQLLQQEFLKGTAETGLEGFYTGELARMFPQSMGETFGGLLLHIWLPWQGKFFYPEKNLGDNILAPAVELFLKFMFNDWGREPSPDKKFHAFPFQTAVMPALMDPIDVLQLSYDLPQNPPKVRTVTDELVRVGDSYLGKAYLKDRNTPRLVAYFRLKK